MKLFLLMFGLMLSASAQFPELPTIQALRKTRAKEVSEANRDALKYLQKSENPKVFNAFADKWLGERAPVGFACLEQQMVINKHLCKDFFFQKRLLSYAIRKNPTYGRPFLIRLLTNKQFPRHEVAVCFLEIDRMGYSTYWFSRSQWYSLLADYLTDNSLCVKKESVTPGQIFLESDSDTGKIKHTREPDIWTNRRVCRYEAAYNLLPAYLKSPDMDFTKVNAKSVRKLLKPTLEKVAKKCEQIRMRNLLWSQILNYRKSKTQPDELKKLLDKWGQAIIRQPKKLHLSDLQYLVYLLMREVQLAEKGNKEAAAGVKVVFPEVMRILKLAGIPVEAPGEAERKFLGETRLWFRAPLKAIIKETKGIRRIKYEMDGFWNWVKDLDPAIVDESTMLSPRATQAK